MKLSISMNIGIFLFKTGFALVWYEEMIRWFLSLVETMSEPFLTKRLAMSTEASSTPPGFRLRSMMIPLHLLFACWRIFAVCWAVFSANIFNRLIMILDSPNRKLFCWASSLV